MTYTDSAEPVHVDAPLAEFSECHHDFVARLHSALYLPELVTAAARARAMAEDLLALFSEGVFQHHQDEERELFPAVIAAALPGDEAQDVRAMVRRLVDEHRDMERRWAALQPAVQDIAAGGTPAIDHVQLEDLVQHFFAHAHYEEEAFLPAAQRILGRHSEDMAALGKALHARHAGQAGS
jgi:hemerythrin-like domain-containing protein